METVVSPTRIWSDQEVRKVASLLAILRDSEELARGTVASDDVDLAREYQSLRTDALATLRALLAPGGAERVEDEMEATHPGIRKPPG